MLFRGSDAMASLPGIHGLVHGSDAIAFAVRTREPGLFGDGFTKLLVKFVDPDSFAHRHLTWVSIDDFTTTQEKDLAKK